MSTLNWRREINSIVVKIALDMGYKYIENIDEGLVYSLHEDSKGVWWQKTNKDNRKVGWWDEQV